jgi:hypothetical protein
MNHIFLLQAEVDIQSAFGRYEDFQAGRGEVFMRCLDVALTLLRSQPRIGPPYEGPYRRLLIRRFPYGVFMSCKRIGSSLRRSSICDRILTPFASVFFGA